MQVERAPALAALRCVGARVFAQLRPRSPLPVIEVRFCRFANPDSYARFADGRLELRLSDLLEGAPPPVLEALLFILLGKLFRKPVPALYVRRYRAFLNRRDVRRNVHLLRLARGRKFISGPRGTHYDLEELFEALNTRFFNGLLACPRLGWSRRASRATLGHYDAAHNAIILSRWLDRPAVPRLVLEYVLYHEMLHLRFPARHHGAFRRAHTRELQRADRAFPERNRVRELLKTL